jgi:hypothetical protein
MEITVGIDVSKERLDVHLHPGGEQFAVGNDQAGAEALVARLGALPGLLGPRTVKIPGQNLSKDLYHVMIGTYEC